MGFLLNFCLKSHLLVLFQFMSKILVLTMYFLLPIKKVTICENSHTVLYWVFAQILSEISPFVQIFDKNQQNKDDVLRIRTLHLWKLSLHYMGFLLNFWSKSFFFFFNLCVKSQLLFYFFSKNNQKKMMCLA